MSISATYDERAAMQRGLRGRQWFASETPTGGRDERTGLELEVDATGWPLRVTRLEVVTDELRRAEGLLAAIRRATGAATLAHLAENAQLRTLSDAELARGQDLLQGRRRLVPPPAYRAAPVTRPREPVSPAGYTVDVRSERVSVGVSRDGEVQVEMGWVDGLRSLQADPDFLDRTPPDLLRYALTEAFTAAQEGTRR